MEVLREAKGKRTVFTCSFQIDDVVLLHMLLKENLSFDVLFLDTGYHFEEVYSYMEKLKRDWGFKLILAKPELSVQEFERKYGKLYEKNPDLCCKMRKVMPLLKSLENYEVWITGLRREQSPTRRNLQPKELIRLPSGKEILKLNPLCDWTYKEVWSYQRAHSIPYLSLYDEGYTSIGCKVCTQKPKDPNDPRSGRWGGKKLECGIHTFHKEG